MESSGSSKKTKHAQTGMGVARGIAKGVLFKIGGGTAQKFIGLLFYLVILRLLDKTEAGFFFIASSLALLVIGFVGITNAAAIRFIPIYRARREYSKMGNLIATLYLLTLAIGLAVLFAMLAFPNEISGIYGKPIGKYMGAVGAIAFVFLIFQFSVAVLDGFKRFDLTALGNTVQQLLKLILAVLGLFLISRDANVALWAYVFSVVPVAIFLLYKVFKITRKSVRKFTISIKETIPALKFSTTVYLGAVAENLSTNIDILMIGFLMPIENVAAYTAVMVFVRSIVPTVFGPIYSVMQAILSEQYASKSRYFSRLVLEIGRWATYLGVPALVVFVAFSPQIIGILYPNYSSNAYLSWYFIPMVLALLIASGSRTSLFAGGNAKELLLISVVVVVPNVILNYIFISIYGLVGAAVATSISTVAGAGLAIWIAYKKLGAKIHPDIAKSLGAGAISLAIAVWMAGAGGIGKIVGTFAPAQLLGSIGISNSVEILVLVTGGAATMAVYSICILIFGGIGKSDISLASSMIVAIIKKIPFSNRVVKW